MHKLLLRQLARVTGPSGEVDFAALLPLVDAAYVSADVERDRLDRAALLTCEEMDQLNGELRVLAHHDVLTGLPNRLSFTEFARRAITRAKLGENFALLFIDVDRFKAVNDTLGHATGDALLIEVGRRLRSSVRGGDEVARMGGDEFAIITYDVEPPHGIEALARRLIGELRSPYTIFGHRVNLGASVGIVVAEAGIHDVDQLLRNADLALYRAKDEGRCTFRVFEPEMATRGDAAPLNRRRASDGG